MLVERYVDTGEHEILPGSKRTLRNYIRWLRETGQVAEQKTSVVEVAEGLKHNFHVLYEKGRADGTIRADLGEHAMFFTVLHVMLAEVTRYAVGLVYAPEATSPEVEPMLLKHALLRELTQESA